MTLRGKGRLVGYLVLVLVLVGAGLYAAKALFGGDTMEQTAYFTSAKGIYAGDDVRILGVQVGRIDSISPEGSEVKITFSYDSKYKVPDDAKVAIIAPSLVSSRFVQIAPAYSSGPTLPDHSVLHTDRTAVPVEFDQVKTQLTKLATALGPKGANSKGALAALLNTVDANLKGGNAERLHTTLTGLSKAVGALNNSKGDLFATIRNLNSFLGNLVANDQALQAFSGQLNSASALLNENRTQLATALDTVDQTMKAVTTFLGNNRSVIKQSTVSLAQVSQTLAYESHNLADILHSAPTALDNFYNIYDPRYNSLNGAVAVGQLNQGIGGLICQAFAGVIGTSGPSGSTSFDQSCSQVLTPIASYLGLSKGINGLTGGGGLVTGGTASTAATPTASSGAASAATGATKVLGGTTTLTQLLLSGVSG